MSFMVFDTDKMISDKPYTTRSIIDVKKLKLSVKDQVDNYKYEVDQDTLEFWAKQSQEVRDMIKPAKSDITVNEFTDEFVKYLSGTGKIDYWWSRSNTFDPIILWRLFDDCNKGKRLANYIKHWDLRELRTYMEAKFNFEIKNNFTPIADEEFWEKVFKQHDSSWDVLADGLRMQSIIRAESDLEQVKR